MRTTPRNANRFWTTPKTVTALSLVVFLSLAGTVGSYASWMSSGSVTGVVGSGAVTVKVDATKMAAPPFSNTAVTRSGSFSVTNTSTADGEYSLSLAADSASVPALASQLTIVLWQKSSGACATAAPTGAITGTWAEPSAAIGGSLKAGATVRYCVQTTIADRRALGSASGTLVFYTRVSAVMSVGSWTGANTATASQSTTGIYSDSALDPTSAHTFTNVADAAYCVAVPAAPMPGGPGSSPVCVNAQSDGQPWLVQLRGDGHYQFVVASSGLCVQSQPNALPANRVCDGSAAQLFTLSAAPVAAPVADPTDGSIP